VRVASNRRYAELRFHRRLNGGKAALYSSDKRVMQRRHSVETGIRTVQRAEVQKVAMLARLKLTEEELDALATQLTRVLDYVHILDEVDTQDVEPMAHAVEQQNVFRADETAESIPRDLVLANAAKSDGKFFLVPAILDAGS